MTDTDLMDTAERRAYELGQVWGIEQLKAHAEKAADRALERLATASNPNLTPGMADDYLVRAQMFAMEAREYASGVVLLAGLVGGDSQHDWRYRLLARLDAIPKAIARRAA